MVSAQAQNGGRRVVFGAIIVLACLASFHGYFQRWGFRDESPRFSLQLLLEGRAERPFVYRQLVPYAANLVVDRLPPAAARAINAIAPYMASPPPGADDRLIAKYSLVYYGTLAAFILAICVLYRVCLHCTGHAAAALLAAVLFALTFPIYMTTGGYFYDHWELLFFALAFLIALRGNAWWLVVLAVPATLNKESFLLFLPVLIPLVRARMGWRTALSAVGAAGIVSTALNLAVKHYYAHNAGAPIEWHLGKNLVYWAQLKPLFIREIFYGVALPPGFCLIELFLLAVVLSGTWRQLGPGMRQTVLVALAINIPLLFLFCVGYELRDLSMLYVPFAVLIAFAFARVLGESRTPAATPLAARPAVEVGD